MSRRTDDPARVFVRGMGLSDGLEWGFWLILTVFWIVELDLGPLELVFMGTILEGAVLLGETPTGVVADVISRKRSLIIAQIVMGVGFIWAVASTNYWLILPAQAVYGIGWTFRSGADVAWVTDELKGEQAIDDDVIDRLLLRKHRFGIVFAIATVALAMVIGTVTTIRWAGVMFGLLQIGLAGYFAIAMREDHFTPGRDREQGFVETLRGGVSAVRGEPRLRVLVLVILLMSLGGDAFDRLGWVHFLDAADVDDSSLVVLGVLFIVLAITGFLVNAASTRYLDRGVGVARLAVALLAMAAVGGMIVAATNALLVIALGYMFQDSTRESLWPILEGWANRDAPSAVRATVHSLMGQTTSVGQLVGGLLIGVIAELSSIRVALVVGAVLFGLGAMLGTRGIDRSAGPTGSTLPAA